MIGSCVVSSSPKGQTECYAEQQSLSYTSHIWGAIEASGNLFWKSHNEKKILPLLVISGKVIYQGLPRDFLVTPHLPLISKNIRLEQNNKPYLLSETLYCVHEKTGSFLRPTDFS